MKPGAQLARPSQNSTPSTGWKPGAEPCICQLSTVASLQVVPTFLYFPKGAWDSGYSIHTLQDSSPYSLSLTPPESAGRAEQLPFAPGYFWDQHLQFSTAKPTLPFTCTPWSQRCWNTSVWWWKANVLNMLPYIESISTKQAISELRVNSYHNSCSVYQGGKY